MIRAHIGLERRASVEEPGAAASSAGSDCLIALIDRHETQKSERKNRK